MVNTLLLLFLDHYCERLRQHAYPRLPAVTACNQAPSGGGLCNYISHIYQLQLQFNITMNLNLHTCSGLIAATSCNQATSGGGLFILVLGLGQFFFIDISSQMTIDY